MTARRDAFGRGRRAIPGRVVRMLRRPLELAFRGGLPAAVIAGLMESAVGNDSFRVVLAAGRCSGRKPE